MVIERVPWTLHGSGFTKAFEDQVGRLAVECSKAAVATLMRIARRTVGRILERLAQRLMRPRQQLTGLCRIGIDSALSDRGRRPRERAPGLGGRGA